MTSFTNLRNKQIPALLMTAAQRQTLHIRQEVPDGQLALCSGYVTRNMHHCPVLKEILANTVVKNKVLQQELVVAIDEYLGQLGFYRTVGMIDPMAGKRLLSSIKHAHDLVRNTGDHQKFVPHIDKHIDEVGDMIAAWQNNQSKGTAVDVGVDYTYTQTVEGVDFRLSKAYYDVKSKKWIQRKIDNVDKDLEKTYQKEGEKVFKASQPVKESFSFKTHITESELNTLNRLQPEGEVTKNMDDSVYTKKKAKPTKPSFKVASNVQEDPLSS